MQETMGITIDSGETATNKETGDQSLRQPLLTACSVHTTGRLGRGAATSWPFCTTAHIYVFPATVRQAEERLLLKYLSSLQWL